MDSNLRKLSLSQKEKYHSSCVQKQKSVKHSGTNIKSTRGSESNEFIRNGKRYIRIVTNNMVRELLIPSEQKNVHTAVFHNSEFEKLSEKKPMTDNDKQEALRLAKEERDKKAAESTLRKKLLLSYPSYYSFGPKLKQLEMEAARKANYLMERAHDLKREQDDEIKECNVLILSKKCQAIRDAQKEEKKIIEKELAEEEKRINDMMEQERIKAIRESEKEKEAALLRKKAFIAALQEQIKDNQLEREIQAERLDEEAAIANEAAIQVKLDDLHAMQAKLKEQEKKRKEMCRVNEEIKLMAENELRESKLAELRVQECIKQKIEEELRQEEERLRKKMEKEKELAKLQANQLRDKDLQAEKDTKNALRIQAEVEAKMYQAEKAAALKKAQELERVKLERQKQIEDRQMWQALEMELERKETLRLAKLHELAVQKEQEEQLRRKQEKDNYRMNLLKQINEKEKERIKMRQELFKDGIALNLEQRSRTEDIERLMRKKMQEIRIHSVPEKYVRDIELRLNLLREHHEQAQ